MGVKISENLFRAGHPVIVAKQLDAQADFDLVDRHSGPCVLGPGTAIRECGCVALSQPTGLVFQRDLLCSSANRYRYRFLKYINMI